MNCSCCHRTYQQRNSNKHCPVCKSEPTEETKIESNIAAQRNNICLNWILFLMTLLIGVFALPLFELANNNNDSMAFAFGWFTIVILAFSFLAFHRVVNQPMLHINWYLRPEWIVRLVSGSLIVLMYFNGKLIFGLLPIQYTVGITVFSLALFVRSMQIKRLR